MKTKVFNNCYNFLIIVIPLTLFYSCKKADEVKNSKKWEIFTVDNKISKNNIFKKLDKEKEIFSVLEKDTLMRKTIAVDYINNRNPNYDIKKYSNLNNCRSSFWKKDTLSIHIGISDGFCGSGFTIFVKNDKFYTKPYYFTDNISVGEKQSTYKIICQKLTLNKSNFIIGDSVYGKIDFKSVETDNRNEVINHSGVGYFRTKIKQL